MIREISGEMELNACEHEDDWKPMQKNKFPRKDTLLNINLDFSFSPILILYIHLLL